MSAPALRWAAIVVAAGRGVRFGRPKQLEPLGDLPMVAWPVRTFAELAEIETIVVVTEAQWLERVEAAVAPPGAGRVRVVPGGATRQESVRAGLEALAPVDAVLVHDGARPLIRAPEVRLAMGLVRPGRGAIVATPAVDTIKSVDAGTHLVSETLDRHNLWMAQTPQLATYADFMRAHQYAAHNTIEATDDAALLERVGVEVAVVEPAGENFKVTTPDDLLCARALLGDRDLAARGRGR